MNDKELAKKEYERLESKLELAQLEIVGLTAQRDLAMSNCEYMERKVERLEKQLDAWKVTAEDHAKDLKMVVQERDQASAACTKYREEAEKLKNIIMNHVYKHGCEFGVDLEDDVNPWKAKAERLEKENEFLRMQRESLENKLQHYRGYQ